MLFPTKQLDEDNYKDGIVSFIGSLEQEKWHIMHKGGMLFFFCCVCNWLCAAAACHLSEGAVFCLQLCSSGRNLSNSLSKQYQQNMRQITVVALTFLLTGV